MREPSASAREVEAEHVAEIDRVVRSRCATDLDSLESVSIDDVEQTCECPLVPDDDVGLIESHPPADPIREVQRSHHHSHKVRVVLIARPGAPVRTLPVGVCGRSGGVCVVE